MKVLEINVRLPGLNEIVGAGRRNRYGAAKQKKEFTSLVATLARGVKIPSHGEQYSDRIYWLFVWREPNKRRDPDNVAAGAKFIFDGLQAAGAMENDGWKQVHAITHVFTNDKENPGVTVYCYTDPVAWAGHAAYGGEQ